MHYVNGEWVGTAERVGAKYRVSIVNGKGEGMDFSALDLPEAIRLMRFHTNEEARKSRAKIAT